MKKHIHKHRKNSSKQATLILGGVLVVTVALIAALIISNALAPDTSYVITADGHVHTADGAHVGDAAEMFGSDYIVTEDGHVHAADGTHIGSYEDIHDHEEDAE